MVVDSRYTNPVMFIIAALEKILGDKDTRKSHNAQLRAACEGALQEIRELVGETEGAEQSSAEDTASISSGVSSVLPEPAGTGTDPEQVFGVFFECMC